MILKITVYKIQWLYFSCCRFELALQQNEILDVFYDDYLSLADDETTFGAKSDNYLKVLQNNIYFVAM